MLKDCQDILKQVEKAKEEFFKLKEELGVKKDIENWRNMSVMIRKDRGYYRLTLAYAKTGRSITASITSFPRGTTREEVEKTEEYKKAKRLTELFKVIKAYKELIKTCEDYSQSSN